MCIFWESATQCTMFVIPFSTCAVCFPQLGRYTKEGELFLGPLGSTGDDTRCVVDDQISSFPQLLNCDKVTNMKQKTWRFSQVRSKKNCTILCLC